MAASAFTVLVLSLVCVCLSEAAPARKLFEIEVKQNIYDTQSCSNPIHGRIPLLSVFNVDIYTCKLQAGSRRCASIQVLGESVPGNDLGLKGSFNIGVAVCPTGSG